MIQSERELLLVASPNSPGPASTRLISLAALSLIGCSQQAGGDDSLELAVLGTSLHEMTIKFDSHER